ncbi:hypothetical protein ACIP5U_34100 [Streptomyces sp. NPDC088788]|uniref:hypothetical protein n=1 Tax=Streptomyces sp. NPDC088788 TaxID=3365898 RepID=UPI00382D3619
MRWNSRAAAMSPSDFTRSVGLRMTVLATTRLQKGALDQALDHGQRAISVLSRVQSAPADDYVSDVVRVMVPWRRGPWVQDLSRRARAPHPTLSEA